MSVDNDPSWIAQAAQAKLRSLALASFLDEWQAENGAFTETELAAAEREAFAVLGRS